MLAKTGAERSVDDFVSLRTAMKYYDNLAKRKRRLKKKVKVPLVVIFLLIFIPAPEQCGQSTSMYKFLISAYKTNLRLVIFPEQYTCSVSFIKRY